MFEIIAVFGAQMVLSFLLGYGVELPSEEEGSNNQAAGPQDFTDGDDIVVSEDYAEGLDAYLADLVAEGEMTEEEAEAALDTVHQPSGALFADTGLGDDTLIGSDFSDTLGSGEGNDVVQGGAGDDLLAMAGGDDVYGADDHTRPSDEDDLSSFPISDAQVGDDHELEAGNDTIWGGAGDDSIADGFGSNLIHGSTGHDFIVAVDEEEDGGADTVSGGWGRDEIIVDEGDVVSTGDMGDWVAVDIWNMVETGYEPVTITDFNRGEDQLVLMGEWANFFGPTPTDPDLEPDLRVSVEDTSDDLAAVVLVSGIPVVVVVGGQGMSADEIELRPY